MIIIKDKREWIIQAILKNEDCPYLFYPMNWHACKLLQKSEYDEYVKCTLENCPIRVKDNATN